MIIHLIPPLSHPAISCVLNFPCVLSLPHLPIPAAWSAQIQHLTSLRLEDATNIHLFDKAVGLVARIHELELDIVQKEIIVSFIDGRSVKMSMGMDCARMLQSVADDVRASSEPESYQGCASSATSSIDDLHSLNTGSSSKPVKPGKHKRRRSLLFSLISSLVPKSSTPSLLPLSPTGQPRSQPSTPGIITPSASPSSSNRDLSSSLPHDTHFLRARARATLIDAWRLYVLSALSVHMPLGGYIEWVLSGLAAKTRAEVRAIENDSSYWREQAQRANNHARCKIGARNAFDLGARNCVGGRWRSPSPFPGHSGLEDAEDRVVYPRRDQANEWGVRVRPRSPDGLEAYTFEVSCGNESLMGESFSFGDDDLDDDFRFTFDINGLKAHTLDIKGPPGVFDDSHLHTRVSCDHSDEVASGFADTSFDLGVPVVPSDANEDDDSDKSQPSPRTPDESEELPLSVPSSVQTGLRFQQQPSPVARSTSSKPRPRTPPSSQNETATLNMPPKDQPEGHSPAASPSDCYSRTSSASMTTWSSRGQVHTMDELIAERLAYLERIRDALRIVRSRAQEEGWRLVRASVLGGPTGWSGAESDRLLEARAKRRAWSSGLKVAAPYVSAAPELPLFESVQAQSGPVGRGLNGKVHPLLPTDMQHNQHGGSSSVRPSGGPLVPMGLSLGKPLHSSPLSMHVWTANDLQPPYGKYGAPSPRRVPESLVFEKWLDRGISCVSFPDRPTRTMPVSPTRLLPLCEESEEDINSGEGDFVEACKLGHDYSQSSVPNVSSDEHGVSVRVPDNGISDINTEEDPFYFSPVGTRSRTTSMYSASVFSTSPILPILRPPTPTPSHEVAVDGRPGGVGENIEAGLTGQGYGYERDHGKEVKFDASSILLRPLSRLSFSPPPSTPVGMAIHQQQYPRRPPLTSNQRYVSQSQSPSQPDTQSRTRPRSLSLPAVFNLSSLAPPAHLEADKHASSHMRPSSAYSRVDGWNERCGRGFQDLSQSYVAPPPSLTGPIVLSAVPAPHEQYRYPRYAHIPEAMHPPSSGLTTMCVGTAKTAHTKSSSSGSALMGVGTKGQDKAWVSGGPHEGRIFELDEATGIWIEELEVAPDLEEGEAERLCGGV